MWIIQALAYVAVITLYFVKDGREIAFAIYIPVDCVLFLGMASYYFYIRHEDKQSEAEEEALNKLIA